MVSAENLALALSGFSSQESEAVVYDFYDTFGKKREIKKVSMERPNTLDKKEVYQMVDCHYLVSDAASDGWKIHSDGTREQQNTKGHVYTLIRFVEEQP